MSYATVYNQYSDTAIDDEKKNLKSVLLYVFSCTGYMIQDHTHYIIITH